MRLMGCFATKNTGFIVRLADIRILGLGCF